MVRCEGFAQDGGFSQRIHACRNAVVLNDRQSRKRLVGDVGSSIFVKKTIISTRAAPAVAGRLRPGQWAALDEPKFHSGHLALFVVTDWT